MKKSIYIYLCISLTISLNGQVINSQELDKMEGIKRNTSFKLEEIKVRWKKAALENCLGVPCPSFTCGTSTITDIDNNTYSTVSIGTQCWTTTNLKVTKYNDGTLIGDSTNSTWGRAVIGARTGYDVSVVPLSDYVGTFGYLYNWYAVNDARKICPSGWHVPTDGELNKLVKFIDSEADTTITVGPQSTTAGTLMKSTTTNTTVGSGLGWNPASPPSPGTNTSGFSALPGAFRGSDGSFFSIRGTAFFWSATELDNFNAWIRFWYNFNSYVFRTNYNKSVGASVRCLKD
jgi:uncharacterized protein (TIGR02145 family)